MLGTRVGYIGKLPVFIYEKSYIKTGSLPSNLNTFRKILKPNN